METTDQTDTTTVTNPPTPSVNEGEDEIRTPPVTPTSSQLSKHTINKEDSFFPIVHNAAQVSSLTEQLSAEILKLVLSLYALKLPALTAPSPQIQSSHRTTTHTTSPPRQLNSSPTSTTVSSSESSVPPTSSHGPFIRLVTQGQGTLIHLGQLVGILDDHSAFLLQRVVSFDPRRVHLHVIASLRPTDILALTEPRRSSRRPNETGGTGSVVDDGNLLSQLIATARSMESGKCPGQLGSNSPITSLTTRHGPVLTTPGLVLIRADQVRELGIIPENGSADCVISPWVFPEQVETGASSEVSHLSGQQLNNTIVTPQRNTGLADSGCHSEVPCFNQQESVNNPTIQPSITGDSVLNVQDLEKMTVQATSTSVKKLPHDASHDLSFCEASNSPSSNDNTKTELSVPAHQKSSKKNETVDPGSHPPAARQGPINRSQKRGIGRKRVTCNTSKQFGKRMTAQYPRNPTVPAGYDEGIAMMNVPKPAASPWQMCGCGRISWGYPVVWRAQGGRYPRDIVRSCRRPQAWSGRRTVMG
ncbi:uncharacterized protein DEA37_0008232 [Paragonimus westermani]|uniref:Uncharacterized protein n=1 Tax=Paragonimus westermani TaxID=34504 RepID=A0A5J4NWW0_9TREM|nr:uncharacterized protein DEA37_0008232 [Paragonimus westermani]